MVVPCALLCECIASTVAVTMSFLCLEMLPFDLLGVVSLLLTLLTLVVLGWRCVDFLRSLGRCIGAPIVLYLPAALCIVFDVVWMASYWL